MFYSIIPAEIVFDEWDGTELDNYREITYNNRQMIVEPLLDNEARIVQLLSTEPSDFLNPDYSPGTMIKFSPEIHQE